ncbi:glutathione S-transferase family protein [Halomonas urumqiensis]|uniref:glutathione transferase n=1 Tax=Halomonas urumqiensis TaxID=1684789 RepID=A0A2N7UGR4_9GAMM|nr:glutathione S-transferase [Halomonas urumqiensis]PMR79604.1 glutathione S-transferase [Halomonas urumqiensis]PTB01054.1 glutathione S-transferase [Halomonas urumqiensis]GHE22871.1 glutathione S-transferase [Halomonas urumqiensis]
MIKVHHLENSRSQRVVWLLEELGVEYQIVTYRRDPKTLLAPASLKRVHPLGKSPVITDEAHDGRVIAESGAIIEYLVERFDDGSLRPPSGSDESLRYRFWLHHAEGSAMPPLVMGLVFSMLGKPPVPALIRPVGKLLGKGVQQKFLDPQIKDLLAFWETELERSTWFAGDAFSGADIQMSFPVLAIAGSGGLEGYPRLAAFLSSCRARDAYQRAVEKAGEFSL